MPWRFLLISAFVSAFFIQNVAAQKFTQEGYLWQRYYFVGRLSNRLELNVETERRSLEATRYRVVSLLPRIQLHYIFKNKMTLGAGAAHFMTDQIVRSDKESYPVRSEVRFHQIYSADQLFDRFKLSHQVKVEERLFLPSYNNRYLTTSMDFTYGFRFRYLIQLQARLTPENKQVQVYFKFYDELLLQTSQTLPRQPFEANRFYGGINVKFSPVWALEAGYLTWIRQNTGSDYTVPHICRITLHHTIDFRKNQD